MASDRRRTATCACGQVALEARGEGIASVACYCKSCRTAAQGFEQMPGAPAAVDPDGGVRYALYRKDRVRILRGAEHLRAFRLDPRSSTRRLLATCCNTPMFVDVTKGHWLTLYADRLPGGAPVEMRVMTRDRPEGVALTGDVPAYAGHSGRFLLRVARAWIAMGFRVPKMPV